MPTEQNSPSIYSSAFQEAAKTAEGQIGTAAAAAAQSVATGAPIADAFVAFEHALMSVITPMVTAAAGPIPGAVSSAVVGDVEPIVDAAIVRWMGGLYKHIGVPMEADLAALFAKL
jgi:hypothetical protein